MGKESFRGRFRGARGIKPSRPNVWRVPEMFSVAWSQRKGVSEGRCLREGQPVSPMPGGSATRLARGHVQRQKITDSLFRLAVVVMKATLVLVRFSTGPHMDLSTSAVSPVIPLFGVEGRTMALRASPGTGEMRWQERV